MKVLHYISERIKRLRMSNDSFVAYPAALPLYFLLGGILPTCLVWFGDMSLILAGCAAVVWAGFGGAVFPVNWKMMSWMLAGCFLGVSHLHAPWATYKHYMPGAECYAEVEAVVVDPMLTGAEDLRWLDPANKVMVTIKRMRLTSADNWHDCSGKVLLYDRDHTFRYGQQLRMKGALRLPLQNKLPHQFDQKRYLKAKGIDHCFYPANITVLSNANGWRTGGTVLLKLRSLLLRNLLANVSDDGDQALLAAIIFGMKNGLSDVQQMTFRRSGMIHLFAVSGLHVGIVFSLVILLLNVSRVPFRWRYGLAPVILLVYVGLTGAESSAVRAWVMLTIWSLCRCLYKPAKALNSVMVAALILLMLNPLSVFQIGFQYSFLLVAAILCGWRMIAMIWSCVGLRLTLIPGRPTGALRLGFTALRSLITTAGAMGIFWLGGFGLTALYGHVVLPMSFFTNMLVGIIAWGIMLLGWLKMLLGIIHIPLIPEIAGYGIVCFLDIIKLLSRCVAVPSAVMAVSAVPIVLAIGYYIIFFWFLQSPLKPKTIFLRYSVVTGCILLFIGCHYHSKGEVKVDILQEHSSLIPIICVRDRHKTILINCGNRRFGYSLLNWLRGEGISVIDTIIMLDGKREFTGSLASVNESVDIASVYQLAGRPMTRDKKAVTYRYKHLETETVPKQGWSFNKADGGKQYHLVLRCSNGQLLPVSLAIHNYADALLTVGERRLSLHYSNEDQMVTSFILK